MLLSHSNKTLNWLTDDRQYDAHHLHLDVDPWSLTGAEQIVVLMKKRIQIILLKHFEEEEVDTKLAAKYSRVLIESKLCFWEQIYCTVNRAKKGVITLSRHGQ